MVVQGLVCWSILGSPVAAASSYAGETQILSGFLSNSAVQKESFYSAFNSAMPDNAQFIYGKLIKIHRAGLLVYALISLNQQAICSV